MCPYVIFTRIRLFLPFSFILSFFTPLSPPLPFSSFLFSVWFFGLFREEGAEGKGESHAGSRPSAKPDVGLHLTTPRSWPALKSRVEQLGPLSHPGAPVPGHFLRRMWWCDRPPSNQPRLGEGSENCWKCMVTFRRSSKNLCLVEKKALTTPGMSQNIRCWLVVLTITRSRNVGVPLAWPSPLFRRVKERGKSESEEKDVKHFISWHQEACVQLYIHFICTWKRKQGFSLGYITCHLM